MVYIPEYVVSRWYEQPLHKQPDLRLKSHLFFASGARVTSQPWQMCWSQRLKERPVPLGADDRRELAGADWQGRMR
jgi:hypothetical protein